MNIKELGHDWERYKAILGRGEIVGIRKSFYTKIKPKVEEHLLKYIVVIEDGFFPNEEILAVVLNKSLITDSLFKIKEEL